MAEYLLAFKAGRAFRREGTNFVDPSPTKGAIVLLSGEDDLLHFIWKNRTTDEIEEDLILFPSDATFTKVEEAPSGRVYVLKFSSSNQTHFFWMQDADSSRDAEFAENTDRLLQSPNARLLWNTRPSAPAAAAATTTQQQEASTSAPTSTDNLGQVSNSTTQQQLAIAQIQALIASMSRNPAPGVELSLTDILTPSNLNPLFTEHPDLIPTLFPHLPPDLPTPPSPEVLQRIINSPQFRAAVQNLDQALRTGLLGGMVRGLGLPEEAGTGIEPFLRAIEEQASRGSSESESSNAEDSMETD